MGLMNLAANLFWELPARKRTLDDLAQALETTSVNITQRIEKAQETDRNRETLLHIIGIERWGQSRLKVALGEPFTEDEYDGYRPADDTSWDALADEFTKTRKQTVEIATQLHGCESKQVKHNQYGDVTVKGWLHYLNSHAGITSRMLR